MAIKDRRPVKPATIDEYLATLSRDKRAALQRVRRIIRGTAPGVEERISYGIPQFRLAGKVLLYIGAAASHCAIYGVTEPRKGDFKGYDTSGRGTLRFAPERPLPAALVRRLVKARLAKNKRSSRSNKTG